MGDLPLRLTGDELCWTGSEGVDVKFLGDLDLSTAPVARDSAATPRAADFGDSAAAPSCFLHGWTMPCGTLVRALRCLLATMLLILGLYNPLKLFLWLPFASLGVAL